MLQSEKKTIIRFDRYYFIWAIMIFLTEIGIALYLHDNFIRPYFGDFLVIILIYCAIQSVVAFSKLTAATIALLFCYVVELAQYLHLLDTLGLQQSKPLNIVLGSSFSWSDMFAYTVGFIFVIVVEKLNSKYISNLF